MIVENEYHASLPLKLYPAADALIEYLIRAPFDEPDACPWCQSHQFFSYPADKIYRCKACKRGFAKVTGTPFANCRYLEKWAAYARFRLGGHTVNQAGELSGLSHGAAEHREKMIGQILTERWPDLLFWWNGLRQLTADGRPAPLRTTPFTSLEEARAHHEHEYIQCLECGKMFSQLSGHLITIHEMTALAYRHKWQIMKQVPLAGLGCRQKHSSSIKEKIASGEVDPLALAALMQEANRERPKKKPFKTQYELETSRQSMLERQPWHISPAIKMVDEETKRKAVELMNNRGPGVSIKAVAKELGMWPSVLYKWRKQLLQNNDG